MPRTKYVQAVHTYCRGLKYLVKMWPTQSSGRNFWTGTGLPEIQHWTVPGSCVGGIKRVSSFADSILSLMTPAATRGNWAVLFSTNMHNYISLDHQVDPNLNEHLSTAWRNHRSCCHLFLSLSYLLGGFKHLQTSNLEWSTSYSIQPMASRGSASLVSLGPAGPGVYAYCYDDAMGLLQCSADSYYQLEFFCYSDRPTGPER